MVHNHSEDCHNSVKIHTVASQQHGLSQRNIRVAEQLVLETLNHEVPG